MLERRGARRRGSWASLPTSVPGSVSGLFARQGGRPSPTLHTCKRSELLVPGRAAGPRRTRAVAQTMAVSPSVARTQHAARARSARGRPLATGRVPLRRGRYHGRHLSGEAQAVGCGQAMVMPGYSLSHRCLFLSHLRLILAAAASKDLNKLFWMARSIMHFFDLESYLERERER